jgi:predicted transcriptional regulator
MKPEYKEGTEARKTSEETVQKLVSRSKEAEHLLNDVAVQMKRLNRNLDALQSALQETPCSSLGYGPVGRT